MQVIDIQVKKIATNIQAELKRQGKLQKDLASYMGITEAALSRLLASDNLKPKYMNKIRSFLGVDFQFFNINSNLKSVTREDQSGESEVEYLKEVIKTKDEVIKAKDDLIETLKEKLKK